MIARLFRTAGLGRSKGQKAVYRCRCELEGIPGTGLGTANCAGRKFEDGVRGKTDGNAPRWYAFTHLLDYMLAIKINEVDRKLHKEGMDRFAGNDP